MIARNSVLANEFSHSLSSLGCSCKFYSPNIQFPTLNFLVLLLVPVPNSNKTNVGGNGSERLFREYENNRCVTFTKAKMRDS